MKNLMRLRLSEKQILATIIGVTLFLAFIAFGRTLTQDFAPLDDDLLITHNLAVRGMSWMNLKTIFTTYDPELYIPLTFVSYQINWMIGGLSPFVYHLTNVLLHAGNALLLMWVLAVATKNRAAAVIAGLLFLVHPLNVEAVAWLAGRKDLLSTTFFLAAWIAYMKYREGRKTYATSVIFFGLALLAKVMAVTLPFVLILTDICIERRQWSWKMLIDKIPHAILSGVFLVIAVAGKERVLAHHSMYETALMAAKSVTFYLWKFLLPIRLGTFYPYHGEISLLLPDFFVPIVILLALITVLTLICLHWRNARKGIVFGWAFFLITLAPTVTNFHKGGEMYFASDRYPYLPMMGLLSLIAMTLVPVMKKVNIRIVFSCALLTLSALVALSYRQTMIWDSARALFGNTLRLYPDSVAARVALATMDKNERRYDSAVKLIRDGLASGDNLQLRMALGTVYAKVGRVEDAADQFNQALALEPENPEPLVALGVLDEYLKKIPEATEKYRKAVELDPSYVSARNKLGVLLLEQGKTDAALEQFRAALEWNPNADGVLYNYALLLDVKGEREEASQMRERAFQLNPDLRQ